MRRRRMTFPGHHRIATMGRHCALSHQIMVTYRPAPVHHFRVLSHTPWFPLMLGGNSTQSKVPTLVALKCCGRDGSWDGVVAVDGVDGVVAVDV